MQPQQLSRIDLGDLRAQLVKRIGAERSKRYFYFLNKLLSQKLSKKEFDKLCHRVLGSENLPLHNHFILSILKNACQAKIPPPVHSPGPTKPGVQAANSSPSREDGHEQSGNLFQNVPVWSNGVLPVSPRKGRSAIRERKLRDRPSPLGPNGKVDSVSHPSTGSEDGGSKIIMENGDANPFDYQRPMQHLQPVAELPERERDGAVRRPTGKPQMLSKDQANLSVIEDGEEVEQSNGLSFSKSPLLAPLGIPLYSASVGGARKAIPVGSSSDFVGYYDSGGLSDTETLRNRMEQIAAAQGLGGVSMECANMLNNVLDVYLKRLIKSCVELVGARSALEPKKNAAQKQQIQGKVAMELNPQQLGEDWPLLLEKICMQSFEE
ncbi:hypothetical protein M0R45_012216 [Rubus argutus]|uniref:Transcriptional coactivator Hfi1/Transcriptional adapter 1 n=1 Tax=Rubus argutus TaxID=59490 RepID=A0AAW1YF11_RUBAR